MTQRLRPPAEIRSSLRLAQAVVKGDPAARDLARDLLANQEARDAKLAALRAGRPDPDPHRR